MKTIAIDFDGVIHKYSKGWNDWTIYDNQIKWSFEFIDILLKSWLSVFIFSTRNSKQIKKWFNDKLDTTFPAYWFTVEIIPFWKKFWNKKWVLWITKKKLPAIIYIDDRAMKFDGNFDKQFLDSFKKRINAK